MQSIAPRSAKRHVWWPLMVLSGTAALTYEICWIRMFALGLGHEMPAMAAVISAFFGGLALGAWALDRTIRNSSVPVAWYVALELIIGLWAVVTVLAIPWINNHLGTWTGPTPSPLLHWTVAFVVPLMVLSPATVAMGATIPAMDRIVEGLRGSGRWIGAIYAANTLGAVAGTLLTTFFLLPQLGFTRTVLLATSANLVCAMLAYLNFSWVRASGELPQPSAPRPASRLGVMLFITGLLGIGYEVLGTRVMAQVQENTVYSFASVLSVYLLFTALGAATYQRWLAALDQRKLLAHALGLLTLSSLLGIVVLAGSSAIHMSTLLSLGPGLPSAVTTEVLLAAAVFAAPTFLMGITFSTLAQMWRDAHGSVGAALGINTLGAALAAPLFAPFVLPAFGAKYALLCVSVGYLLLFLISWPRPTHLPDIGREETRGSKRRSKRAIPQKQGGFELKYLLLLLTGVVGVLAMTRDLRFVKPLEGGEVLEYRDGVLASVAVVTDKTGNRFLKVNDRFRMGGTDSWTNERRLGHIPLLLHPQPTAALFLGLGTGNTLAAAAVHPGLEAEAVELVPEVVQVQTYFESSAGELRAHESLRIHVGDARRYVQSTGKQYDVIVADLFHPARDGSGSLYTREHFRAIRGRLRRQGLFCQWLPLYQMDAACLRIIVGTFLEVFPDSTAYISTLDVNQPILGLVGATEQREYDASWFDRRTAGSELRDQVRRSGIVDSFALFGLAVASPQRLKAFAKDAPINSDDHARITFVAPRFIYSRQAPGYVPLFALLDTALEQPVSRTSETISDVPFADRLAKFEAARDLFLRAERHRVARQLDEALAGYVAATAESADFRLAPALLMMQAQRLVGMRQKEKAVQILKHLLEVKPDEREARELLRRLEVTP